MSATPNSGNTLFGRGQVFFDRFDANGVAHGQYVSLGNCDSFAISMTTDEVDMVDYTQSTSLPYNRAIKATNADLKISGFEVSTKNMAILVLGDITSYTQTAHTATGQTETLVPASLTNVLGCFFKVPFRSISAPTVVQGANTLVSGTDYEIFDASSGTFHILPSGVTVVDSTVITVNYTAAALSGGTAKDVVRAGNTALLKGSLLFLPNVATGPQIEVRIYNASLAPDGDIGLISDDFLKWNMKGSINSDASGTYGGSTLEPFFRTITR